MTMYIRSAACLSSFFPLEGNSAELLNTLAANSAWSSAAGSRQSAEGSGHRLSAIEPDYSEYIDSKMIRRMSRIVKMGVATAMRCLQTAGSPMPAAIITGTAYGCLEDTGVFLRKMIGNEEELLSPTAFIQSTHNTVGAQVALLLKCHAYNNTIVHRAFSFEHALTEARMLLAEGTNPVLVGAIDETTDDSFALLSRFGVFRNTSPVEPELSAGEGAAFFLLQTLPSGHDLGQIELVTTRLDPEAGPAEILLWMKNTLTAAGIPLSAIGTVLDGSRDRILRQPDSPFAGADHLAYKSLSGEFPTASGFALWLSGILAGGSEKKSPEKNRLLLFNRSMDGHGSLIVVSPC